MTNYDQWRDMPDPETPKRYRCEITHLDTCLSGFFQGFSHSGDDGDECAAVPVDHTTTVREVIDGIDDEVQSIAHDWDEKHWDAFNDAVYDLRRENEKHLDAIFDDSIEPCDDERAEPVYAYFGIRFYAVDDGDDDA